jgi:hypothetical protein
MSSVFSIIGDIIIIILTPHAVLPTPQFVLSDDIKEHYSHFLVPYVLFSDLRLLDM